jgi:hypothetical protein
MVCAEVVLHLFAERLHSFVGYLQRHYLGPSHFARYASQQSQIARTLVFTKRLKEHGFGAYLRSSTQGRGHVNEK